MKRLAAVTIDAGYDDVWTYVNSGNVVFDGTGRREAIEDRLRDGLRAASSASSARRSCVPRRNSASVLAEAPFDLTSRRHLFRHVPQVEPDRRPGPATSRRCRTPSTRSSCGAATSIGYARPFERLAADEAGLGAHPRPRHLDEPKRHDAEARLVAKSTRDDPGSPSPQRPHDRDCRVDVPGARPGRRGSRTDLGYVRFREPLDYPGGVT